MNEDRDPRSDHDPVDQAGTPERIPPPWLILGLIGLGVLMLAAVAWATFGH